MTIQYPNNLDTLTNPTGTDKVSVVSHASQHADANDAIEALEAKVGVDNSAVTTTHDFKLSNIADGDKSVSLTGTETLTNKTLSSPVLTNPSITSPNGITSSDVGLGNVTNDLQVKQSGAQTIDDVKTFSSSPIVPDPVNATDAANKQWTENYVTGTGKETVGLYTQGAFVDSIETNLKFSRQQTSTEVALTGAPTISSLDSLDGVNFITTYGNTNDLYFGEYSKSGTVFSAIQAQSIISSINAVSAVCRYINSNNAVIAFKNDSSDSRIHVALVTKSGSTWTLSNTAIYTLPASSSTTAVRDVIVDGTDIYIAVSYVGQDVYILKATAVLASGLIAYDNFWTVPIITSPNNTSNAKFNSSSEIFVAWSGSIEKYSFVSGSVTKIGNTGVFSYWSTIQILDDDLIIYDKSTSGWETMEFDGTNYNILRNTDNNPSSTLVYSEALVLSPTKIISRTHETTLVGSGSENSIEDMNANGHLGYMVSDSNTNTGTTANMGIVVTDSTNNNGTYTVKSYTADKVILNSSTVVNTEETEIARISVNLANAQGQQWTVKGSNYYLAND